MRKPTAQQARVVSDRLLEYREVAEAMMLSAKSISNKTPNEYTKGIVLYWQHVVSALDWMIETERHQLDREKHGRRQSL